MEFWPPLLEQKIKLVLNRINYIDSVLDVRFKTLPSCKQGQNAGPACQTEIHVSGMVKYTYMMAAILTCPSFHHSTCFIKVRIVCYVEIDSLFIKYK